MGLHVLFSKTRSNANLRGIDTDVRLGALFIRPLESGLGSRLSSFKWRVYSLTSLHCGLLYHNFIHDGIAMMLTERYPGSIGVIVTAAMLGSLKRLRKVYRIQQEL